MRCISRAPIPYARDHRARDGQRLSGLDLAFTVTRPAYAYRARFLRAYARLAPSPLEGCEALDSCARCGMVSGSAC